MEIKRNSWHYKVYNFMCDGRPGTKTNLCAYFWKVVFGLSVATGLGLIALAILGLIGFGLYYHTAITFMILGGTGAIIGFIPLCYYIGDKYEESEPGLVRLYLKAKKDKVCPLIEFEG